VQVDAFADNYLPNDEIKQDYIDYMEGRAFPMHAVEKDITYIKNKLRQRKVTFTNNVKIIAPADNFNDLLSIEQNNNTNETVVTIKAPILFQD
jgi:hypothetical protein